MLGSLVEFTFRSLRSTYNAVEATAEFIIDDITSIPDAIEKGWNEGLFPNTPKDIVKDTTTVAPKDTESETK